jgi:hypothetical protein
VRLGNDSNSGGCGGYGLTSGHALILTEMRGNRWRSGVAFDRVSPMQPPVTGRGFTLR